MDQATAQFIPAEFRCDESALTETPPFNAVSGQSSADARQPLLDSQGRRAEHDGSCSCNKEVGGASSRGSLIHHKPDCEIYQMLASDFSLARAAMAVGVNTAVACLKLYQQLAERHGGELSERQSFGDLLNLQREIDRLSLIMASTFPEMPLVVQRDGRRKKGAPK